MIVKKLQTTIQATAKPLHHTGKAERTLISKERSAPSRDDVCCVIAGIDYKKKDPENIMNQILETPNLTRDRH